MGLLDHLLQSNGVRLTEASIPYHLGSHDPDAKEHREQGYRRLTQQHNERDLLPLQQDRMIEIALYLYDSNPLAKRIIDLVNAFVTGDGFTFSAKNRRVLDTLTRFWEDPINDWPLKQLDRFKMLSLCGEVLWPVSVRRTDGRVRLGYIDPANIEEIIPDPFNPEIQRTAVIKQGYSVDGVTLPQRYSLVNVDDRKEAPTYGMLNFYPEPYGAFYFSINRPPNATRGRSDLITVFDWLDLYDQLLFGAAERATYLTDFVWDVTMKGADEETLKKWYRENPMPRGAAMRVHNENVTWQAISPNLGSFDIEMMSRIIKQQVLTALGIPPSWISDPGDVNRCFDQQTQYLTRSGWKYYHEIIDGEEIGTYHAESGSVEFQVPRHRYCYDYHGKMVRIKRSHVDFLVTPNHRMLLRRKGHSNYFHPYDVVEAGLLDGKIYKIPTQAQWSGEYRQTFTIPGCIRHPNDYQSKADRVICMEPWLQFLGYWISEGSLYLGRRGRFRISLTQKKPDGLNKIRDCLKNLPFHVLEYMRKDGTVDWIIQDKSLFIWLEQHAGKSASDKRVPRFIFDLAPEQIWVFIEALMLGDGTWENQRIRYNGNGPKNGYYWSTSKRLIDDIQLLFFLCGYHPTIRQRDRRNPQWKTCYTLNIVPARERRITEKDCTYEDYDGTVSCFEVPNGFLITRRNGEIGISGNSTAVAMAGPVLKFLSHRQRFCRAILTKVMKFVVDQAVISGTLADLSPEDLKFEVLSPSLTPSDMSALTNTLLRLVQSVKLAEDQRWISHETSSKVFLKFLTELGIQVAVEDELTKVMDTLRRQEMERQMAQMAGQAAEAGGMGSDRLPGMGVAPLPRDPTGSELQTPDEQLRNQQLGRSVTGETTTRKGNPI